MKPIFLFFVAVFFLIANAIAGGKKPIEVKVHVNNQLSEPVLLMAYESASRNSCESQDLKKLLLQKNIQKTANGAFSLTWPTNAFVCFMLHFSNGAILENPRARPRRISDIITVDIPPNALQDLPKNVIWDVVKDPTSPKQTN